MTYGRIVLTRICMALGITLWLASAASAVTFTNYAAGVIRDTDNDVYWWADLTSGAGNYAAAEAFQATMVETGGVANWRLATPAEINPVVLQYMVDGVGFANDWTAAGGIMAGGGRRITGMMISSRS